MSKFRFIIKQRNNKPFICFSYGKTLREAELALVEALRSVPNILSAQLIHGPEQAELD